MKFQIFALPVAVALFAACSSNPNTKTADSIAADSAVNDTSAKAAAPGHACFIHTEGSNNQDTTKVHLMIDGNKVTGEMKWMPYEKDGRSGMLEGTQKGNVIKALWSYMQEGMKDTMTVEFNFPGDKLMQKPYKVNEKDGRQVTDLKADYTVKFNKVACE